MRLRPLAAAFAVALAARAAAAQTPDLTGRWEVDPARSDFARATPPAKLVMTVEQTATTFAFTQTVGAPGGERSARQAYTLDGREQAQPAPDGITVTGSARAADGGITVDATIVRGGTPTRQTSRWTLSPDGKTMTLEQQVETPNGPARLKLVFDRK
jgi:hypothetical protein